MVLLWSGLNIILLLSLFYLCVRITKLLKQRMGWGAALLFIFGLMLVGGSKTPRQPIGTVNLLAGLPKNMPLGNASSLQTIRLGAGSSIGLLAEYFQENGYIQPRGLYATPVGLVIGQAWEPVSGQLTQRGQHLQFTTVLLHKWRLLGTEVYQKPEEFTGLMPPAHL